MKDGDIDYSGYSTSELKEALMCIDNLKYPENYKNLKKTYSTIPNVEPSTTLEEKFNKRVRTSNSRSKNASLEMYYYTNFVCSLSCLPMLLIVSIQENLLGLPALLFVPIMTVLLAFNIEDLKWLFQDHQSRNAWLIQMGTTSLLSFARFFDNDLLFLFLIIVFILVFLSSWLVIHKRYATHMNPVRESE